MVSKFSPKDPQENIQLTFDFINLITDPTEILSNAVWNVIVVNGIDLNPQNIIITPVSILKTTSSAILTGGINGCTYNITVLATTSKNQIFKMIGQITVETQQ